MSWSMQSVLSRFPARSWWIVHIGLLHLPPWAGSEPPSWKKPGTFLNDCTDCTLAIFFWDILISAPNFLRISTHKNWQKTLPQAALRCMPSNFPRLGSRSLGSTTTWSVDCGKDGIHGGWGWGNYQPLVAVRNIFIVYIYKSLKIDIWIIY